MKTITLISALLTVCTAQAQQQRLQVTVLGRNKTTIVENALTKDARIADRLKLRIDKLKSITGGSEGTGGGNTINGRPIEHYQKDTSELDVASDVEAKLQLISNDIPRFGRALEDRVAETKWYILPARLVELPLTITKIGIKTDQTAIQVSKEVYIDEKKWNLMGRSEKTELVLHELVLAQYLWLKKKPSTIFTAITQALSMSDMRRISKLVSGYATTDAVLLGDELMKRNFGYYLTRPERADRIARVGGELKAFLSMCGNPNPQLSLLTILLQDFYMEYRARYAYANSFSALPESASAQQQFEKMWKLQSMFAPSWSALADIYPEQLISAKVAVDGDNNDLFEIIFPGVKNSSADAKMGKTACEKLRTFDYNKLLIIF